LEQIDQSRSLGLQADLHTDLHDGLHDKLANIAYTIKSLAQDYKNDPTQILAILRALEQLHGEICRELLQPALPTSRHSLFDLLRDIDANGGWPYIYRMSLRELCSNLEETLEIDRPTEINP